MNYDVMIVGAGPSGAIAAYELCKNGYSVLLLDKKTFPGDKPCAGGITPKAIDLLPYDISGIFEYISDEMRLGLRYQQEIIAKTPGVMCAFSQRKNFDKFLFDKAIEQGVNFLRIKDIVDISFDSRRNIFSSLTVIREDGDRRTLSSGYLIGADGVHSKTRKIAQVFPQFRRGFALEGLLSYDDIAAVPTPGFDFDIVKFGYGWVFPKGDHANVGLYSGKAGVKLSKAALRGYSKKRLGSDNLKNITGYPIALGGANYKATHANFFLVGDAAGMTEPLLGEGIHNALKSGQMAARAIIDQEFSAKTAGELYNDYIQPIRKDLRATRIVAAVFYRNLTGLQLGYGILKFALSRRFLLAGWAAGKTLYQIITSFLGRAYYKMTIPVSLRKIYQDKKINRVLRK
ncbi:MAG: geranylgeranyl reductase family protein [Alphaproteobacteria bacterium]|nr:geranylgeranyl reductase family protein [Alphaproteobacteria bacterium]